MARGNIRELATLGRRSQAVGAILNLPIQWIAFRGVGRDQRLDPAQT